MYLFKMTVRFEAFVHLELIVIYKIKSGFTNNVFHLFKAKFTTDLEYSTVL